MKDLPQPTTEPVNLFQDMSSKEILKVLNDVFPSGCIKGFKWEHKSVKQWQASRRIGWDKYTRGKWVVYCPLKAVKLFDHGADGFELKILNFSYYIK